MDPADAGVVLDGGVIAGPPTTLALNEVMSRNDATIADAFGEFDDWVELYNLTNEDIALDDFTLEDSNGEPSAFFAGAVVPAKGFLLVFADDAVGQGSAEEPHLPFKLGGAGDTLTLKADGAIIDALTFPTLGEEVSFGRIVDGGEALEVLSGATPGASNGGEGEGEGEGECEPPFGVGVVPTIVINEVLIEDTDFVDDEGQPSPWIELFNAGAAAVALDGLVLTDDAAFDNAWSLPAQSLAPGAFFVVFADGEPAAGVRHASFTLATTDTNVTLGDVCGTVFQTLALAGLGVNTAVGLFPDGVTAAPGPRATPSPGAVNVE